MIDLLFTLTAISFFVLLGYSVKQLTKLTNKKKTMGFNEAAEKLNGRLAMIGFVAAVGAYFTTGQVIPGVW